MDKYRYIGKYNSIYIGMSFHHAFLESLMHTYIVSYMCMYHIQRD